MINRKNNGAFYTPDFLSGFIMRYVSTNFNEIDKLSVFEPSVGDGSFVKAFNNTVFPGIAKRYNFTAIDKVKPELKKAQIVALEQRKQNSKYTFAKADFLKYQMGLKRKFELIVGNPPYIKKTLLNKTQIQLCQEIHQSADLSKAVVKNIWSSFLVRCCQLLSNNGVLAFVLPAELLQVKFSDELRAFTTKIFGRTEIFTFDELMFDCKGQDTILLIGYKQHISPGLFYTHIANAAQLDDNDFVLNQNRALIATETKWTHHFLSEDELTFAHNIASQLEKVKHYCDSKPGIVTAANSFFIINEETEIRYNLTEYAMPIIQKGLFVNGSVTFTEADFRELVAQGKPTKVLVFNDEDANNLHALAEQYLTIGVESELPIRYKCKKRKNWFVIPNISTVAQGFFFKRSHHYPKLLKNNADVLVTDSAYKIEMNSGHEINHLIYSFYNSLTLAFAELNGRYYGGGVLELTPQEFKELPVPNVSITPRDFNSYARTFERKTEIKDILNMHDSFILNKALGLNTEEIEKIQAIYTRLISKRFRNQ